MPKFSVMPTTGYDEFALFEKITVIGTVSPKPVTKDADSYKFKLTSSISIEAIGEFNVSDSSGNVEALNIFDNGVLALEVSDITVELLALRLGMLTGFGELFGILQKVKPSTTYGNNGNDVLVSFTSSSLFGRAGNDTFYEFTGQKNKFDGESGNDTVNYSNNLKESGVVVNLANATLNKGGADGDTYRSIENIVGSQFDDKITGNDRKNIFTGGAGADRLDGGEGIDTANYASATTGIVLDLAAPSNNSGEAGGDKLKNIEIVIGTGFADTLRGDGGDTTFFGGGGDDIIDSGTGLDKMWGDSTAFGVDGADTFVFQNASSGEKAILDYDVFDHIQVSRTGFGLHPLYKITEGATLIIADAAPVATTNSPTFMFEKSTGKLLFDADGNGTGGSTVIATVKFHSQSYIDANDIVII